MTQTYRYDAFGTLIGIQSINEDGVLAAAETALSRFLYAGEQYDSVSGLYYLRARYYDTTVGRFTQEDVNLGDGRNLYAYVSNNPLKYTDPSGYEKKQERVNNGLLNVVSGIGMAVTGAAAAIVATTLAVTATVAAAPALAVAGTVAMIATAAMATGMAFMGISDAAQGAQEIYNAYTGNPNSAPNLIRDIAFGGSQEAYNQAKTIVSVGTTVGLSAISTLPLVMATGTSGAISYYANMNTSGGGSGNSGSNSYKTDFYVTPKGDAIPTNATQFDENLSIMDETNDKYIGETMNGPVRVRIEGPHPLDENFNGDWDGDHFIEHIHIEHRKNGASGPWGKGWHNKTTIPLDWIDGGN